MHSSQYRKLPRSYSSQETFYFQLTAEQQKMLAHLLPKGCILVQQSKSKAKSIPNRMKNQQSSMMQQESSSAKHTPVLKQPVKTTQKNVQKKPAKLQMPEVMKPCIQILNQLKSHKNSWPFLQPVDPIALGIPQYNQIIKQPMDLSTIQKKLNSITYKQPLQFYRDVNLMIKNSYDFNEGNEQFVKLTNQFQKYFFRIAGPQSKPSVDKKLEKQKQKQRQRLEKQRIKQEKLKEKLLQKQKERERKLLLQQQQQAQLALKLAKKKKKFIPKDILQAQNISVQEKQQLANNIHNLSKEHLKGVRNIVFDLSKSNQQNQSQLANQHQFDIQKIGYKKIRQLQKYVRLKLLQIQTAKINNQNNQKKQEIDLDQLESQWTSQFVD